MADLAQAVMSFRPKSDADTDRVYRLFSGLNVTDPMKDAARKSDTLFSENKMLVEQLTAQGLGPEELQSLKAHLALASLISAELRLPSESLELPEITSAHNDQQVLGYRLAELVLEQHSLCLASPGSCHDYIKMLGALWTQFSSVPSAESHLFPRPAASVEGAYMDIATGVLYSIVNSMPGFSKDRRYLLLDNSPFVVQGLNSLAGLYDFDNVEALNVDVESVDQLQELKQPLAALRIKNAVVYA
ncbi:MAG: hypothetical protein HRT45_18830, partial [Bdellovibrionales bacterium]|nr:hypothetical protein [Bdellovibrionales bacterium]